MGKVSDFYYRINCTHVQVLEYRFWFISIRSKLGLIVVIQELISFSNSDFDLFDFQISSTFAN